MSPVSQKASLPDQPSDADFTSWIPIFSRKKLVDWIEKQARQDHAPTDAPTAYLKSKLGELLTGRPIKVSRLLESRGFRITIGDGFPPPVTIILKNNTHDPECSIHINSRVLDGPQASQALALVLFDKLEQFRDRLEHNLGAIQSKQNRALRDAVVQAVAGGLTLYSTLDEAVPILKLFVVVLMARSLLSYKSAKSQEDSLRRSYAHILGK